MNVRVFVLLTLLLPLGVGARAQPAAPPAPPGHSPTLLIYVAKGVADACGRGCDRWIAIEGHVDSDASARVAQFFNRFADDRLPIYFHSPGGSGEQAFAIARMLRGRKVTARVGRTIVDACPGSQTDDACVMIKSATHELRANITVQGAVCNSACGLIFFGATTREVAPETSFGVHNSKITIDFKRFVTEHQRDQAMSQARAKTGRVLNEFIETMGISHDLFALIESVAFENQHFLTREELFRFRIDPRSFGETPWELVADPRPSVRKVAFARPGGHFVNLEWRLTCATNKGAMLFYVREYGAGETGLSAVAMTALGSTPQRFIRTPARVGSREIWSTLIPGEAVDKLVAMPVLTIGESGWRADGTIGQDFFDIDSSGLDVAWPKLQAACARMPPLAARKPVPPSTWQGTFPSNGVRASEPP